MTARRRWLLALVAAFLASRAAYAAAGVHFDVLPLQGYWQYLDPQLLHDDLFRSLWYLHSQPPLYNLFLGAVLNAAGDHAAGVFHAVHLAAGLGLTVTLYRIATELDVAPRRAAIAVGVLMVSPAVVMYETWLYLEYLMTALLAAAVLCALRFARHGRTRSAVGFFAATAAVVAARPLFHLVFLGVVGAVLWAGQPHRRRQVLAAAAVPVALVSSVYVKNAVLFGQVTATSCPGLNAIRIATVQLPDRERRALRAEGRLSRYSEVSPYAAPFTYPEDFEAPRTGVPLLDRPIKSTGAPNFDAEGFDVACDAYFSDAVATARAKPVTLLRAVRQSALVFFRPTDDYFWFDDYREDEARRLAPVSRAYDLVVWGQPLPARGAAAEHFALDRLPRRLAEVAWFVVAAYALALVGTVRRLRALGPEGRRRPEGVALAVVLAVVAYVGLVGNLFEAGENNRFRSMLDPLVLVALLVVTRGWRRQPGPSSPRWTSASEANGR